MNDEELNVGAKIRAFRKGRDISLVELAKRTGIAPSNLSSIELNKSSPTLGTLLKISLAFGMRLGEFLDDALYTKAIFCSAAVEQFTDTTSLHSAPQRLTEGAMHNRMEAYLVSVSRETEEILPLKPGRDRLVYCLSGGIKALVDGRAYSLGPNQCLYLLPEASVILVNEGEVPAALLTVTAS